MIWICLWVLAVRTLRLGAQAWIIWSISFFLFSFEKYVMGSYNCWPRTLKTYSLLLSELEREGTGQIWKVQSWGLEEDLLKLTKGHKSILAMRNQAMPQNHATQQTSHQKFTGDKTRMAAASECEERQQMLDKGKDFYGVFGVCSPSLVRKNHEIGNIVWLLMWSHGGEEFQVSELQVKPGIVCSSLGTGAWSEVRVRMFFPWPFSYNYLADAAVYSISSRSSFILLNTCSYF